MAFVNAKRKIQELTVKNPFISNLVDYLPIDLVSMIESYNTFTVCESCNNLCLKQLKKCHSHSKSGDCYAFYGQMKQDKQVMKFNDSRDLETYQYLMKDALISKKYPGVYQNFENRKGFWNILDFCEFLNALLMKLDFQNIILINRIN